MDKIQTDDSVEPKPLEATEEELGTLTQLLEQLMEPLPSNRSC